ncbi:MAG: hypothetical protein QOJ16_1141 [Acidobacteriota bacterium]|jgi:hypothetical protein|nr:hypothetical protein [Acidobacteriota bacterium]
MKQIKIVVEKHADVESALRFHVETFGYDTLEAEPPVLAAFLAEAVVS